MVKLHNSIQQQLELVIHVSLPLFMPLCGTHEPLVKPCGDVSSPLQITLLLSFGFLTI